MAAVKTTPWFPAAIKPARKGWYEVRENPPLHHRSSGKLMGRPFRYWNGHAWLTDHPQNSWSRTSIFGRYAVHQWRGLAANPKVAA